MRSQWRKGQGGVVHAGDHGPPVLTGHLGQDSHHGVGPRGVERADRFVGQQQVGFLEQDAGDGRALLLATGQLVGPLPQLLGDADRVERSGYLDDRRRADQ